MKLFMIASVRFDTSVFVNVHSPACPGASVTLTIRAVRSTVDDTPVQLIPDSVQPGAEASVMV
jgi:hypothetical protein